MSRAWQFGPMLLHTAGHIFHPGPGSLFLATGLRSDREWASAQTSLASIGLGPEAKRYPPEIDRDPGVAVRIHPSNWRSCVICCLRGTARSGRSVETAKSILYLLPLTVSAVRCLAQSASISGLVTDPSRAVAAHAQILLTNERTATEQHSARNIGPRLFLTRGRSHQRPQYGHGW
jgi:hypothetical protein